MSDVAPGGEDEPDRRRDRTRALEQVPAPGAIGEPRAEEHSKHGGKDSDEFEEPVRNMRRQARNPRSGQRR